MMSTNSRPSSVVPVLGRVAPQSFAANDTHQTAWMDAGLGAWIFAILHLGAVSAGGVMTLTWLQATDSAGTGSKALNTGAFAALAETVAGAYAMEDHVEQLDVANGFRFVRATLTCTVNTVLAALTVHTGAPKNETGPTIST